MSNLVIVAIPDENDRVWKVSSEKIPHLTLLFLGDTDQVSNSDQIVQFVEHAANTTLKRFYLPVDRRGELGDDQADVLFFKKGRYDYKAVRDFRSQLLQDDNIRTAYDSTKQHEGPWQPHLTLGYPDTPAKSESDDGGGFYSVDFNKIAVWFGDFEGPDFLLKDTWDEFDSFETVPMDVVMSGILQHDGDAYAQNLAMGEAFLAHYGVKGMRWGHRKADRSEEGTRSLWDPTGRSVKADLAENFLAGLIFAPLAIPSTVRLYRGAGRGVKAKAQDISEKRDDKKFNKVAQSQKAFVAIHNGAHERLNGDIDKINKKYTDADLAKPAKKKAYDAEVLKSMQGAYKESANQIGNKRGTKHLDVEFKNDGMDFAIKVKEGPQTPTVEKVKHVAIDDDDVVTFEGKIVRSPAGHILGFDFDDFEQKTAKHVMDDGADFLEHYGVKGMHWGVTREHIDAVGRAASSSPSKLGKAVDSAHKFGRDVEFEKKLTNEVQRTELERSIHAKAHEAFKRTDLPAIKDKPEYQAAKKLRNRLRHPRDPATKAYRKEVKAAYIQRLEDAANTMTNASGTRQYTIRERGWEAPSEGGALPKSKHYWDVTTREIKHADGDVTISVEVLMDEDGFITDLKPVEAEDTLAQSMELGADFLTMLGLDVGIEHYGVKGMRWGHRKQEFVTRRHQKRLLAEMALREKRPAADVRALPTIGTSKRKKSTIDTKGGEDHPPTAEAIKVAEHKRKLKKSGLAALSNNDLQEMQRRLNLENDVQRLVKGQKTAGEKFIDGLLGRSSKEDKKSFESQAGAQVTRTVVPKAARIIRKAGLGI